MSTFLILGATGTVGAPLTARLVAAGHTVHAATRTPSSYAGPATPVALDLSSPDAAILEGVDRAFLLSPPGYSDQHAALAPLLEKIEAADRVDRIVTMTAQGVQYDESLPFRRLERRVEASGKRFVHLRPTWFAQNFHTFWGHGVRAAQTLALPAAEARVAFLDARDISASAFAALTREDVELDRAYELTGPDALTHAAAAGVLSEAVGKTIHYRSISDDAFREQLAPSGLPADYIEALVGLFAAVRRGVADKVTTDVEALTGTSPRPLARYAQDHRSLLR